METDLYEEYTANYTLLQVLFKFNVFETVMIVFHLLSIQVDIWNPSYLQENKNA